MKFTPTKEQKTIFNYIENRDENILIQAYAGAGKTTTIVHALNYLPKDKSIMFLAFNKHIQEELKTKVPEYVKCYTTYGLGNSAIKRKYGNKIQFDEFKIDKIINKKSKNWKLHEQFKENDDIYQYILKIKKLTNLCRLTLTFKPEFITFLSQKHDVNLTKSEDIKRVLKVLDEATLDRKTYDFTDMIYLPAVDNSIWMFPQDYVIVDEVQDTNRCQYKIIEKILRKDKVTGKTIGRLILVGDPKQSIYSFNGSGDDMFEYYKKFPNIKILPLSYSFRCGKNIIAKANEIVPEIKALDSAIDGVVRNGDILNEVNEGDFVLCRTTMPLIKLFFQLLIKKKKAIIRGSDIGLNLIELIGNINNINTLKYYWENKLNNMINEIKKDGVINPDEHSGYVTLEDKVNALLFLAKLSSNIDDLKSKINTIFTDNVKGVVLSTIHKAKGLEADRVFIIRPDLIPLPNTRGWQLNQEKNLEYVAYTRAKKELIIDVNWSDEE